MSLMQRLLPTDQKSVDASLQDQQMINTFSRLHMTYMEVEEQRKDLKKRLDDIESASVALLELDDTETEALPMVSIGGAFFPKDSMDIDALLETQKAKVGSKYDAVVERHSKLQEKLDQLRDTLQQKFKGMINLDYNK